LPQTRSSFGAKRKRRSGSCWKLTVGWTASSGLRGYPCAARWRSWVRAARWRSTSPRSRLVRPTHHPNHAKRTWARARRGCLVAAVWIGVLLSAAQLRGQGSAIAPNPLEGVGIEQRLNHAIPLELHFRDHQGRDVTLESLQRGRPVVLSLI